MAGKSTAEVRLGAPKIGGYAFRAPMGTTIPGNAAAALDAAYVDQGFISEEGVILEIDGKQIKIRDWNLDTVAVLEDETSVTVKIILMQRGEAPLKTIYGDENVTATGGTVEKYGYAGGIRPHSQWSFEMRDGVGPNRLLLNDAQVTAIGSVTFAKKDVQQQEVTLELFRDVNGVFFEHLLV